MPGRLANLIDVECPDALLHARGTIKRRGFGADEVLLEGHHSGIDEQQCRIVVEQRCGRHHFVTAGCEEIQEAAPNLGGFHDVFLELRRDRVNADRRAGRAFREVPFHARPFQLVPGQ